jgi:hypothetical protein
VAYDNQERVHSAVKKKPPESIERRGEDQPHSGMCYGQRTVRHPPQSGWLDELGRLKGGWCDRLGVARCAPYCHVGIPVEHVQDVIQIVMMFRRDMNTVTDLPYRGLTRAGLERIVQTANGI